VNGTAAAAAADANARSSGRDTHRYRTNWDKTIYQTTGARTS